MKNQSTLISYSSCPLCGDESINTSYKHVDQYTLSKCSRCELIFLNNFQAFSTLDFMEKMDSLAKEDQSQKGSAQYWGLPCYMEKHADIFNHYMEERLERIRKYISPSQHLSVLDVGCGHGYWCRYLEKNQIQHLGIDISPLALSFCQKEKINAKHTSIEAMECHQKFSVITLCDVLEHVDSPQTCIQKCSELLETGGLLYIQVPDLFRLKIPFKHPAGLPDHRWHFGYKAMRKLLNDHGLIIKKRWTGILGIVGIAQRHRSLLPLLYFLSSIMAIIPIGNRLQILAQKQK